MIKQTYIISTKLVIEMVLIQRIGLFCDDHIF